MGINREDDCAKVVGWGETKVEEVAGEPATSGSPTCIYDGGYDSVENGSCFFSGFLSNKLGQDEMRPTICVGVPRVIIRAILLEFIIPAELVDKISDLAR